MSIVSWIKGLFSNPPKKTVARENGITRAADKHQAVAHGKAQADYKKRKAEKRAPGVSPKHQPMRKRGKS